MRKKVCKRCGKIFEASGPGVIVCADCKDTIRHKTTKRPKICTICGASFSGGPAAKYCPNCRQDRQKIRAEQYRKTGFKRKLGSMDKCVICGAEYVVESGLQKYCKECGSQITKSDEYRMRKNTKAKQYRKSLDPESKKAKKVCLVCGKPFESSKPTVTCSEDCAKELQRRRYNEVLIRQGRRKIPADARYDSGLPKSGIVGITFNRRSGRWQVTYKRKYYGIFSELEDAKAALEKIKRMAEHGED